MESDKSTNCDGLGTERLGTARFDPQPLALARLRMGLTMDALADLAKVSSETVSEVIRGLRVPSPTSAKKLCDALGVAPALVWLPPIAAAVANPAAQEMVE